MTIDPDSYVDSEGVEHDGLCDHCEGDASELYSDRGALLCRYCFAQIGVAPALQGPDRALSRIAPTLERQITPDSFVPPPVGLVALVDALREAAAAVARFVELAAEFTDNSKEPPQ